MQKNITGTIECVDSGTESTCRHSGATYGCVPTYRQVTSYSLRSRSLTVRVITAAIFTTILRADLHQYITA